MSRSPRNCGHSDIIRLHGNGKICVCMLEENKQKTSSGVYVCDAETCLSCGQFLKRYGDKDVADYCRGVMSDSARCGKENPKLAALLWVLDGEMFVRRGWIKRLVSFLTGGEK